MTKLVIEMDSDQPMGSPLTEEEMQRVERAIANIRNGNFAVTSDPNERDRLLADGVGVTFYRREEEG